MTKFTQNELVMKHLKTFGNIEPMTALRKYGIMRLASRIFDLKTTRRDADIKRVMIYEKENKYALYVLRGNK